MKAQLKNHRMVSSLAQRPTGLSKSMASSRYVSASFGNTPLRRDESDSMSPSGRNAHNSVNREDRYQRSQLNIDKKMREDFDRL